MIIGDGWVEDTPGGLNRYVSDLLAGARRDGATWRAVLVGPAASAPVGVVAVRSRGSALPLRLVGLWWAARRVARDADIIDSHFALYGLLPTLTARLFGRKPLVVHFQGPWAAESEFEGRGSGMVVRLKLLVEALVYRRAAAFVVLTRTFREELVTRYAVDRDNVHVIPPAIDLERFTPGERGTARQRLGLGPGPVVVTVRRLVGRMGIEDLLEAWRGVITVVPDAQLVVVGEGPRRSQLELIASDLGRSVRFSGRVSDEELVEHYRAADLSVVPSVALEGFGLIVLESLACGTPVVVTTVGGLPEAVEGLEPTLLVPPRDPEALGACVADVLTGHRDAPSPEACRVYAEQFSQLALAEAHRRLYESVVQASA
jgi:glycosyltransferase involved in cell wall biosynthesis